MRVHFIGAGPGDPELITVRGLRLIRSCPVVLYAGSLVPRAVLSELREDVHLVDTSSLALPELEREYLSAYDGDLDVARVHSGDPSLYGAIAEQTRLLRRHGIAWTITPGVPAFAAAAAALGQELTLPEVSQTVILTRTAGKSSRMPEGEELSSLAAIGATLAVHLSARNLRQVVRDLTPHYGADCPAAVAYRIGWPDGVLCRTTLRDLHELVLSRKWTRTVLVLVGPVLARDERPAGREARGSALYDPAHPHIFRPRAKRKGE